MKASLRRIVSVAGTTIGYGLIIATPSFAQVAQLTSGLDWIKGTITGLGIVIMVIAIMWTGIKMMFQHAKWSEVASIFFGGMLVGGAAAIGPQLFSGGGGT